ncbi:MAG: polysaccharide biosynthesis tyrosine autokinase [Leptolyngbya sp. SIO1D8]|nr:polysaccharide biosynthesis tyrosine autokinase [Leptolyngbya sp. SIO1D8]
MEERDYIEEIDLQKYWLVLRRRWLPAFVVFATSLCLGIAYAATRTPIYQAGGSLLFQIDSKTTLTGIAENLGQLESVSVQTNPLETQALVLRSNRIIQDTIEKLDLRNETGQHIPPKRIRRGLIVKPLAGTDVLSIVFQHSDPAYAAAVVNQLMRSYIANDIEANRAQAVVARSFLDQELPQAQQAVENTAEALRRFKDENNIVSLEREAAVAVDVVANLNSQINETNTDLAGLRTRVAELAQQLGMTAKEAADIDALNQAPGIQQALNNLQQVQEQLVSEQARYTNRHPVVANLQREESAAYELLQERVAEVMGHNVTISPGMLQGGGLQEQLIASLVESNIEQLALNSRMETLTSTRDTYLEWSSVFPDLEKQQRQLESRLSAAQATYESLLARKQEIELAETQQIGNASIIQEAEQPSAQIGRSTKIYIAAGGAVGVLMGIAVAFLLDLIDRSLKTIKEAETLFGYPVLGVIPNYAISKNKTASTSISALSSLSLERSNPIMADAYQMLQANLKFISSDRILKTYVVSSSTVSEGKSSVAAQLAMSLSQSGREVLLIDANMRSPDQHHIWNVINGVGLSHVLVGEGTLPEALQSIAQNLTLMTAGVKPPNPLALLDSDQMAELLNALSHQYEKIIIDTPALTGAADAAILGKMADGVMLVVRPRQVDSSDAIAAKSLLERSGANILGLVANGVDIKVEHEDYASATETTDKETVDELVNISRISVKNNT